MEWKNLHLPLGDYPLPLTGEYVHRSAGARLSLIILMARSPPVSTVRRRTNSTVMTLELIQGSRTSGSRTLFVRPSHMTVIPSLWFPVDVSPIVATSN